MKQKLLLKSLVLLFALIAGSSSAWADSTDSYTATSSDKPTATNGTTSGSVTGTNSISWSYSVTQSTAKNKSPYVQYSDSYGWQLGSGNSPCTAFSISTSGISGTITQIQVVTGSASASSTINVTVGGNAFGTQSQATGTGSTVATQTFNGSASGEIIVSATASSGAFYFKSVTVTYTPSGGGSDPSITAANVNIDQDATNGSIAYTLNNATGTVSASITSGDWLALGEVTASAVPFTCSANTGAERTATVTLSFTGATDKVVTITQAAKTVEKPTFSPESGSYLQGTGITLTSAGNTIYYNLTTDGSNPADPDNNSTKYTDPIVLGSGTTKIKAIAYDAYGNDSGSASRTYTGIAPASLPFSWAGGGKTAFKKLTGVVESGLGSDYGDSHSPYMIKFDDSNDFIEIFTNEKPVKVTIGVKMIGGGNTSKIKVQESTNGVEFSDVQELTISGSSGSIVNLETSNAFATTTRVVKLLFVKGSNVGVGPITIAPATVPATINSTYKWATFSSTIPLDFTYTEVSAYIVTGFEGTAVTKTQVYKVPANTGLLLNGTTDNIPLATGDLNDVSANKMVAVTTATTISKVDGKTRYVLADEGGKAMFLSINATPADVPAGKAYLEIDGAGARELYFDDTTAIKALENATKIDNDAIYDLSGRRVENPTKGIYIMNGKKVIFK